MMTPSRYLIRRAFNTLKFSRPLGPCRSAPVSSSIYLSRSFSTGRIAGGTLAQKAQSAVASDSGNSTIVEAKADNSKWMLDVQWKDWMTASYPYIWLRDNCQCPECFHPSSLSRRVLLQDLDISVTPQTVNVTKEDGSLEIHWSDGHKGFYPANWLLERSFTEDKREKRREEYRFHRTYWGSDMINRLPTANFNELLQDDCVLLDFLMKVEEYGLVIVKGTPCRIGEIVTLSNRVGFLKRTHYGKTFSVKQKIDANNLAYTSDSLNLHVDLPYVHYKPGVQLLHCISQVPSAGGDNHFVDSFNAAQQLKQREPEKFDLLVNTQVDFDDIGVEESGYNFNVHNQEPTIVLDRFGAINTVNFNQMVRDSFFDAPAESVRKWYEAMLTFHELLYHPDNLITYKLNEGEIAVFDNNRVMHGRLGYHMTDGNRELEGCYWDWDMIKSCKRTIKSRVGK